MQLALSTPRLEQLVHVCARERLCLSSLCVTWNRSLNCGRYRSILVGRMSSEAHQAYTCGKCHQEAGGKRKEGKKIG